ncbi:hypothetical protein ACLB2K_015079 [Fragaria x ananassa]
MQDIILALVQPLAEWTVRPVWRQLSYLSHYKSNIEHLNEQVRLLRDKRDGVNLDVIDARRALKEISPGVDRWLGDVDKIIVEDETSFSEETVAAKAACYNGWLPNLNSRHSLGRKAKKMTEKVDKLLANEPRSTVHPAAPPKVEFQPTEDLTLLGTNFHEEVCSRAQASEARKIVSYEDYSAPREQLVVCKSLIIGGRCVLLQLKGNLKESLDKDAEVIRIQGELAEYLGKELLKDIKERGPRASKLRERLSQGRKKILVMLHNVWTTTRDMLWDIGIPPSCQLLVTSRQQFMDMDRRKNFPIHGLSHPDAWRLFKERAGSCIESDPKVHVEAEKILKKCGGLPIAILTVGTALKDASIEI